MRYKIVIPARYASTRLEGKPLLKIGNKTMIERVHQCAQQASSATEVVVATDDERIATAVSRFGGDVCMTSSEHQSGTDRLQEVAMLKGWKEDDIIVNLQGDEPLMPAALLEQVARNLNKSQTSAATLYEEKHAIEDFENPNIVKVVCSNKGNALYFSRAPIPWPRELMDGEGSVSKTDCLGFRHIGLYAYKVETLNHFVREPQCQLESLEKLEQLRLLANGYSIHVDKACESVPGGVDTQEDLEHIRQLFNADQHP